MTLNPEKLTPEIQPSQQYLELLQRIKADPCSTELWRDLESLAFNEKGLNDDYSSLTIEEIIELADFVIPQTDSAAISPHLAKEASSGKAWYDIILGNKGNKQMFKRVVEVLSQHELRDKWTLGIDLGTGTGDSLVGLSKVCSHAIGTDKSRSLLAQAQKRNDYLAPVSLVKTDVTNLGFLPNNSVDVAINHGLHRYLSRDQFVQMASELHRVLRSDGTYFFVIGPVENKDSISDDELEWLTSPKALMIRAIAEKITSLEPDDTMSISEEVEELLDWGFEFNYYGNLGVDDVLMEFRLGQLGLFIKHVQALTDAGITGEDWQPAVPSFKLRDQKGQIHTGRVELVTDLEEARWTVKQFRRGFSGDSAFFKS